MAILKCKMCGGTIEINNNETVATCDYCGVQQTLPKLDDEKKVTLYDRANHFRRNNEFDKAMGIYEQILNEDNTDAESYWSLVLCRYGIEYVEDPVSHKRVPTVNRAQFTSVFDDADYKSALQYADTLQKTIYEDEANAINEIQKGILAISQKEEPFDVFICYKETDANGRRTPDSVLANDLYHQLTQEGFKVFFARITLEDKLGSAYEPYIFAALNSAKVMVVLGTKPEFFNAVWVKNEWSRYLALVKNSGGKKILIPAYKDMDPYDLPEEFSHLQAQDMSKLGFMQDLIRGIKKIAQADEPKTTVIKETVVAGGNANIDTLLKRVFIFLEDGDWGSANEYCEKVLDIDPENAQAYLGKLMAEIHVRNRKLLKTAFQPFNDKNNYQKVMRYGDEALKKELEDCTEFINNRNETARLDGIYNRAKEFIAMANFEEAAKCLNSISDYKDSASLRDECLKKAEEARLENTYNNAKNIMNSAKTEEVYKKAADEFRTISEFKDAATLAEECIEKAEIARKDAILSEAKEKMKGRNILNYQKAVELLASIPGWRDADELKKQAEDSADVSAAYEKLVREINSKKETVSKLSAKCQESQKAFNENNELVKKAPKFKMASLRYLIVTIFNMILPIVFVAYTLNTSEEMTDGEVTTLLGICLAIFVCCISFIVRTFSVNKKYLNRNIPYVLLRLVLSFVPIVAPILAFKDCKKLMDISKKSKDFERKAQEHLATINQCNGEISVAEAEIQQLTAQANELAKL